MLKRIQNPITSKIWCLVTCCITLYACFYIKYTHHLLSYQFISIQFLTLTSRNMLSQIVGGLCNNLLTCIVRSWDEGKPLFVAPSMSGSMWRNPTTERHCMIFRELGITLIPPSAYLTPSGECEHGAMSEPSNIHATVRKHYWEKMHNSVKNLVQWDDVWYIDHSFIVQCRLCFIGWCLWPVLLSCDHLSHSNHQSCHGNKLVFILFFSMFMMAVDNIWFLFVLLDLNFVFRIK